MHEQPTPSGIPLDRLRVDERYWPKGASEVVRRWLVEEYDPATMPPLVVSEREDGYYVIELADAEHRDLEASMEALWEAVQLDPEWVRFMPPSVVRRELGVELDVHLFYEQRRREADEGGA
jgi:hypothetical protein